MRRAGWRARSRVAGLSASIHSALADALGSFSDLSLRRGNVKHNPVRKPGEDGACRRVKVFHGQPITFRIRGCAAPLQRRRNILAVAGILFGNGSALRERTTRQGKVWSGAAVWEGSWRAGHARADQGNKRNGREYDSPHLSERLQARG
jgi:hypothetical protein